MRQQKVDFRFSTMRNVLPRALLAVLLNISVVWIQHFIVVSDADWPTGTAAVEGAPTSSIMQSQRNVPSSLAVCRQCLL